MNHFLLRVAFQVELSRLLVSKYILLSYSSFKIFLLICWAKRVLWKCWFSFRGFMVSYHVFCFLVLLYCIPSLVQYVFWYCLYWEFYVVEFQTCSLLSISAKSVADMFLWLSLFRFLFILQLVFSFFLLFFFFFYSVFVTASNSIIASIELQYFSHRIDSIKCSVLRNECDCISAGITDNNDTISPLLIQKNCSFSILALSLKMVLLWNLTELARITILVRLDQIFI